MASYFKVTILMLSLLIQPERRKGFPITHSAPGPQRFVSLSFIATPFRRKRGTIPMCTLLDHSFFRYALLSILKNQHHARQYETKIKNRSSQRTQSPPGRVKHGWSSPYLMVALRTTKVLQEYLKCYTGLWVLLQLSLPIKVLWKRWWLGKIMKFLGPRYNSNKNGCVIKKKVPRLGQQWSGLCRMLLDIIMWPRTAFSSIEMAGRTHLESGGGEVHYRTLQRWYSLCF